MAAIIRDAHGGRQGINDTALMVNGFGCALLMTTHGYRVHTIVELSPSVTNHQCLVWRMVPAPSSLALVGAHQRHEVIGDLPTEALLALVWGW